MFIIMILLVYYFLRRKINKIPPFKQKIQFHISRKLHFAGKAEKPPPQVVDYDLATRAQSPRPPSAWISVCEMPHFAASKPCFRSPICRISQANMPHIGNLDFLSYLCNVIYSKFQRPRRGRTIQTKTLRKWKIHTTTTSVSCAWP